MQLWKHPLKLILFSYEFGVETHVPVRDYWPVSVIDHVFQLFFLRPHMIKKISREKKPKLFRTVITQLIH